MKNNPILIQIEGNMPYSAEVKDFIKYDVIRNFEGKAIKSRRIYSSTYNKLFIPLAKIEIRQNDLIELFEQALENSEESYYDIDNDYEYMVERELPSNFDSFLQFLEANAYYEEFKDYESYATLFDYLFDIIYDHLADFCPIRSNPDSNDFPFSRNSIPFKPCNCEDYPCCGH